MLALDPPGDPTIGACIAANLSGPRRHRYGTMRDLVIGVTVVLADGTIASSGGKVVKNVAGYDLGKLFCGSEGRLGLIARVALRLHPRPEATRTLAVPVSSAGDAAEKALAILRCAARAVSASTCSGPTGSRCCSRAAGAGRRAVRDRRRRWSAARRTTARSGRRPRRGRAGRRGGCCSRPGKLAETLGGLDEAVVRVAAGVAYVPEPVADPRDPAEVALAERVARSSIRAGCWSDGRDLARPDRRLRPLRLLPADVPDLRGALAGGDGLAARADLADGRAGRRDDPAHRHDRASTSTAASAAWRA